MIVPDVQKWIAGETVDADKLEERFNQVLEFLLEPPQALATQTVTQTISNAAFNVIDLDTTLKDNDGIVDLSLNRLTIQTPGWYEVVSGVGFSSAASGDNTARRISAVRLNGMGGPTYGGQRSRRDIVPQRSGAAQARVGGSLHAMFLNKGDYLELVAYQDSGISRTTYVSSDGRPMLGIKWVSN